MGDWQCLICGFIYEVNEGDPENEVYPGTEFEDLPDNWVCPDCGNLKSQFEES